jgi:hypothetical protein
MAAMKPLLILTLLLTAVPSLADTCHHSGTKGYDGKSTYYEYGNCSKSYGNYRPQSQSELEASAAAAVAYIAEIDRRAAREKQYYAKEGAKQRSGLFHGAHMELGGSGTGESTFRRYENAAITPAQKESIRAEIGASMEGDKLIDAFGKLPFDDATNPATWAATDPATRWKNCEVGGLLARAYLTGDFAHPGQKDPQRGLAIATAGASVFCGATAYWLARGYEEGDALVPGFDAKVLEPQIAGKDEGFLPQILVEDTYDIAIVNGYTPAYERIAELYRKGGPARFVDKEYTYKINWLERRSYPYWREGLDHTRLYLMRYQYQQCIKFDPTNLTCARGLRSVFASKKADGDYGYTNYDPEAAAAMARHVNRLESELQR